MEGRGFEVAPGIHRIEGPLGERYIACYLVVGDDAALLVDTGVDATPAGSIVPYLATIGLPADRVHWVVVTHCDVDHMGGNAAARAALPAATFVAGARDVELMEDVERIVAERYSEFAADHDIDIDDGFKAWCSEVAHPTRIDVGVEAGFEIRLGGREVEVFATPGHSAGSVSVWDAATRSAIIGDAVLGATIRTAAGEPAFPPTYRDVGPYRATIAEIERNAPAWLLASHEPVMDVAAGRRFLAESREYADRLERLALEALRAATNPLTTRALIDELAPVMGSWPRDAWMFLANGLVGHLEAAAEDGRVRAITGHPVRWEVVR
jgi:glyoxylase-like metal-dependent hydrolase (beta-lactamase superfamily II)